MWFFLFALFNCVAVAAPAPKSQPPVAGAEESGAWRQTLDRVSRGVVSIRVTAVRDFDTENASVSQGTGFVIDEERGIILTNRHMVHAGPVVADAVFLDGEEIPLVPIYRDPIHDFGFYQFDPKAVRYMDVEALPLAPEVAAVGLEIRVVGNDAGEKISILDGTLARLDRNAPAYGDDTYNDFNTFYYQAASNTSGGSSGSPVVDIQGRVVALNAGGNTRAASSFYLPLFRVVRAYQSVVAGVPNTRGTLGAVFEYTPFDELKRLGLTEASEAAARKEAGVGTGLLVVDQVVPGTPGDGKLRPGDVLLRVDGRFASGFVPLEEACDGAVGRTVKVEVERAGQPVSFDLAVADLEALSPRSYLEVSRGIVHDLSFSQARNHNRPVQGVYVAVPGYMLSSAQVPSEAVITHVDGEAVSDLAAFQRVLEGIAQGQRFRVRYQAVANPRQSAETVVTMDRLWYPMQRCTRDDGTGLWPCVESPPPPAYHPPPLPESLLVPTGDKPASLLANALVLVEFDIPHPTSGVKDFNYAGVGVVVDAAQGLVLLDRDTVPVALGDMTLTFAGVVRVPGKLRYLHPLHDFAIVQYDPASLGGLPVSAAQWSDRTPSEGDEVWQVGLNSDQELVAKKSAIDRIEELQFGMSGTPRFRDTNVEGIDLESAEASLGGVLCDKHGKLYALWASFYDPREDDRYFHGLPAAYIRPALDDILRGEEPKYRALGAELATVPLYEARDRGLSDARIKELAQHDPKRRVLQVLRAWGGTSAGDALRDTDLILAIDGEPVTQMNEIEALHDRDRVNVTVLRDGEEQTFQIDTVPLSGDGVDRVVVWAGLVVHAPHIEVASQQKIAANGVYVAWLWFGSPGSRYGLRPTAILTSVNDTPIPDLDAFLAAVSALDGGRAPVRLGVQTLDGSEHVATLLLDPTYWPTGVLERGDDGAWVRYAPQDGGSSAR